LEGIDTESLPGSLGVAPADEGRVVYVASGGGLTYTEPSSAEGRSQAIGVVIRQDATSGVIAINNPSTFTGQPPLPEGYVWIGDSSDIALAHRLNADSFQVRLGSDDVVELALASNIKFGGYEFLYDGDSNSKIQVKVSSEPIETDNYSSVVVATFDALQYRSAKFLVQLSSLGLDANYEISEILIIHNSTTAHLTQYGIVRTFNEPDGLGVFDAFITPSGECQLTFRKHRWISNNIIVRAVRTSILV
jgi:hypothetical protein